MIRDDTWWYVMIRDDTWWYVMIRDDTWWYVMIRDDTWRHIYHKQDRPYIYSIFIVGVTCFYYILLRTITNITTIIPTIATIYYCQWFIYSSGVDHHLGRSCYCGRQLCNRCCLARPANHTHFPQWICWYQLSPGGAHDSGEASFLATSVVGAAFNWNWFIITHR